MTTIGGPAPVARRCALAGAGGRSERQAIPPEAPGTPDLLTRRRLKRGVFPSLVALQEAINRFIEHHNQAPRPFTWKADPKTIIAAAKRGHQVLETIH